MGHHVTSSLNSGIAGLELIGENFSNTWLVKKERVKDPISDEGREAIGGKEGSVCSKSKAAGIRIAQEACTPMRASANHAVKIRNLSEEWDMTLY